LETEAFEEEIQSQQACWAEAWPGRRR